NHLSTIWNKQVSRCSSTRPALEGYPGSPILWTTSRPKGRHWEIDLSGQTSSKHWIMNKLEMARRLARQTAGQGRGTEKEKKEVLQTLDYIGTTLQTIRDEQKGLSRNQQILAEGTKRSPAPLESWKPRITDMENTLTTLVKQQRKTRRLLMTIFFTGIVPLLALIADLVIKLWILT